MAVPHEQLIQFDVDLKPYNTLNISHLARRFAEVYSGNDIQHILESENFNKDDVVTLGGGSNVLFAGDCSKLVMRVGIKGRRIVQETNDDVWLRAGAGENWHQLVRFCVEHGWGGVENLSLIPGTVGAAPVQNIGAYGVEFSDVFEELQAIEIESGTVRSFGKRDCKYGYRDSIFKNELKGDYIITQVILKLDKKPSLNTGYGAIQTELEHRAIKKPSVRDISDIIIDIRNRKLPDPQALGNAGSFFENPVIREELYEELKRNHPQMPTYNMEGGRKKIPAAWLIEEVGWKGRRVGQTGTFDEHALVIVNHGGATGDEILNVVSSIQQDVGKTFNIELVPEVNIMCR